MSDAGCAFCDQPGDEVCNSCSRVFCAQHGGALCMHCTRPEAALPSPRLFIGAVAALVTVTAAAVFLFIQPPSEESQADTPREATRAPAGAPTATATQPGEPTATEDSAPSSPTTEATATSGTATPDTSEPTATATASTTNIYSVQAGDTLSGIAAQFDLSLDELIALNPGLDPDAALQIGQEITVPGSAQ